MYCIVYLTKNDVSGKMYVGVHSTFDLNDGYLGSGKILKRAIRKYGKDHFSRTILHYCLTEQDAFDIEHNIVDDTFINRRDTYNAAVGGKGGNMVKHMSPDRKTEMYRDIMAKRIMPEKTPEHKSKLRSHMKELNETKRGSNLTDQHKQSISNSTKGKPKNFSTEELARRSRAFSGDNNPCKFGGNKKLWRLTNVLGQEYLIDDLAQFCSELGINRRLLLTRYRVGSPKHVRKEFWEISKA